MPAERVRIRRADERPSRSVVGVWLVIVLLLAANTLVLLVR
ncbi:MAG TPA: hypothetical protein VGB14_16400 [Acidimicrobiales bacterium]|jgi:hypothetical protein